MNKKWWHNKVVYQIYPKSFNDSNGDGIGDLPGIIEKLDYLKDLGVDIIWLSPCYKSPMADQGYDISDYYAINPDFGTMEDMERLIAEAKKRGMLILMDLVVNHCSDEHEWFKEALRDPEGKFASYFYIEKGVNGHAPNNWRSYFGGSAWEPIEGTDKYYLHLFHKKQPDLNWENPLLREEIYKMINWWLDKGLGGFRIDAIMNIKKALPLPDFNYEPDRPDGLAAAARMLKDAKGLGVYLKELRDRTFKPHDSFTAGEVAGDNDSAIKEFIGEDGYFSTMFDFRETEYGKSGLGWYDNKHITPDEYKECCFKTQRIVGTDSFISTEIENHDQPRAVSYYIPEGELSDTSKKFLATMQIMQRGVPFIYEGQELGMENVPFKTIDEFNDVSTLDEYKVALKAGFSPEEALKAVSVYSRDNARTPFQWDSSKNAGFSQGTPWLKLNPNYTEINAKDEQSDENSVLSYYKKLIALRKNSEYEDAIVYGEMVPYLEDQKRLMAYYRKGEKHTLLILGNFKPQETTVELPSPCREILLDNLTPNLIDETHIKLSGYEAVVILL